MKQAFIFLAAIFIYVNSFGQNESNKDSSKAIKFGFFIEPTYVSGNLIGRVPLQYKSPDWSPGPSYTNPNPEPCVGYSIGFEIQIKELNNFSFKTGLSFEYFKYSASADINYYDYLTGITNHYCTECYDFYYKDYFVHLPFNVEYYIIKNSTSAVFFDAGVSLSHLVGESTSSDYEFAVDNPSNVNMFAIAGIGAQLEAAANTRFIFEPVFKYELFKKPNVQYAAIGLKIGLIFD